MHFTRSKCIDFPGSIQSFRSVLFDRIENLSKAELIEPKAIATDVGDAQFGFGDTLIASERKCYASFIPFSREEKAIESNNLVDFTTYSEDWSCNVSSKFDEDTTTVNSDEVESVHNDESVCEVSRLKTFAALFNKTSCLRMTLNSIHSMKTFLVTGITRKLVNVSVTIC